MNYKKIKYKKKIYFGMVKLLINERKTNKQIVEINHKEKQTEENLRKK